MRIVTHKVAFLPNNQSNIDDSSITAQVTGWSKGKPNAKAQPPRKGPLLVGMDKPTAPMVGSTLSPTGL